MLREVAWRASVAKAVHNFPRAQPTSHPRVELNGRSGALVGISILVCAQASAGFLLAPASSPRAVNLEPFLQSKWLRCCGQNSPGGKPGGKPSRKLTGARVRKELSVQGHTILQLSAPGSAHFLCGISMTSSVRPWKLHQESL